MKVRSPKVPPSSSGGSLSSVPAPAPTQRSATCTFSSHSRLGSPWLITFPHCPWWSVFAYALPSDAWVVTFAAVIQRSYSKVSLRGGFFFVLLIFTPHLQATEQVFNRTSVQILVRISHRKREKASLEQTGGHGISYPQPHADEWTEMLEYKPLVRACQEPSCASKLAPFWLV